MLSSPMRSKNDHKTCVTLVPCLVNAAAFNKLVASEIGVHTGDEDDDTGADIDSRGSFDENTIFAYRFSSFNSWLMFTVEEKGLAEERDSWDWIWDRNNVLSASVSSMDRKASMSRDEEKTLPYELCRCS
jgi:hypothetical protein